MGGSGSGRAGRVTLFLAALNLLVLGIGFGVQYVMSNRAPSFSEFNAEKIRSWSQPEAYQSRSVQKPAEAGTAPSVPTSAAPEVASQPSTPTAAPAAAKVVTASAAPGGNSACLALGELSQAHYQDMQTLLKNSSLGSDKCNYMFDKKLAWWVFWPPEYEASRREKVLESIHAAGVKDVMPITQGALMQAFSVGVFSAQEQARLYRDKLRSKGLDKIEYGPRPTAGQALLGCRSDNPAQLSQLKASLPAWVKPVDAQKCPAPVAE